MAYYEEELITKELFSASEDEEDALDDAEPTDDKLDADFEDDALEEGFDVGMGIDKEEEEAA